MTTIKEKVKRRFKELCICVVEQDYSITLNGRIYIDLIIITMLKKILQKELNINNKIFWGAIHNGKR